MRHDEVYLGRDDRPPGMRLLTSGKVRDIYTLDAEKLLFITTDRVSAFDVVMNEGVAEKGRVLTAISAYWFEKTKDLVENHLLSTRVEDVPGLDAGWRRRLRGRVMLVRRADPTTVEWVVRGYIAGSGCKDYQKNGSICGIALPKGLSLASPLLRPILTPTTKDEKHDRPITADEARERVGPDRYRECERAALALFERGSALLERIGILLADTKFEFGVREGRTLLIDEALTPDSSRFWARDTWQIGSSPPSYDKQILRDWLETLDWNKEYPPPPVDPAILTAVSERYLEICEKITGKIPEGASV